MTGDSNKGDILAEFARIENEPVTRRGNYAACLYCGGPCERRVIRPVHHEEDCLWIRAGGPQHECGGG